MATIQPQRHVRLRLAALLAALAVGLILTVHSPSARAADDVKLTGAGSTFVQPLLEKWSSEYSKSHPNVTISYNGIGSGGGITTTVGAGGGGGAGGGTVRSHSSPSTTPSTATSHALVVVPLTW